MSVNDLLSLRMILSVLIIALILNKNIKQYVFSSVPTNLYSKLFWNCTVFTFSFFLMFYSISALPLVEVALIINTIPLLQAVLGYIVLKEVLTKF